MENYKNTINTKFLNYLSDSILMVLGSESIIVSTIIDESLIIDGFTESNVLPSNNELKNIVNSCCEKIYGHPINIDVVSTIISVTDSPGFSGLSNLRVENKFRPVITDDVESESQPKSVFPHGYSLNYGRTIYYYLDRIFNNIKGHIGLKYGYVSYNNEKLSFVGKSFYTNKKVESLILDHFDFESDLEEFKTHLSGYDFTRDVTDPFEPKPWLDDSLIKKIESF